MTTPKRWIPGDPLTADRLNEQISEALRPRRDIALGNGSSMVNETLGNQSATNRHQPVKLVVAVTDFVISEVPTDIAGHADDVPSGLVREVRLGRRSGVHSEDTASKPFLAYDPVSGLGGAFCSDSSDSASSSGSNSGSESAASSASKSACDVFHVIFNQDSKRWEVLSASGTSGAIIIRFEIVEPVFCEACTAYARILSRPEGVFVVPGESNGEVEISDRIGCHLNEPNESLIGRRGYAAYMKSDFDGPCPGMPNPSFEIMTMCCLEEELDD